MKRALAICEKAKCLYSPVYVGNLGYLYVEMGRYAEAAALLTRAVSLQQKSAQTNPSAAEIVQNLANLYMASGRDEEAEAGHRRGGGALSGVRAKRSPQLRRLTRHMSERGKRTAEQRGAPSFVGLRGICRNEACIVRSHAG